MGFVWSISELWVVVVCHVMGQVWCNIYEPFQDCIACGG